MACARPLTEGLTEERRERRVISVLFVDLVGFTRRAERLDVEDIEGFLGPYHALLRAAVDRTGGVVSKFAGDGLMALFGAPAAHEDDPERAVRCALEIRDALAAGMEDDADRLQVRAGVTTGEALVVLGSQTDAIGDVVNTASRLESAASADGILVDDWTYRATNRVIRYEHVDPIAAKGKSEPVPAWSAIEPLSALPEQARDDDVPIVGRDDELSQLVAVFGRARHAPSAQLVTVVGPPGIGKSRLLREFAADVAADRESARWLRGRSLPYGDGIAFWALGEMVKAEAGILESDPPSTVEAKLGRSVADLIHAGGNGAWVTRHLRPLAGLEAANGLPTQGRVEAFAAWRQYLEALATERPSILVFEDVHWADDALLDFLDLLTERVGSYPLLIVCTARPELFERRPHWGGGKVNSTTLMLVPLSDHETTLLVEELLDRSPVPADVQSSLLARAEGNPLYAHEFVRMLRDQGMLRREHGEWLLVGEPSNLPESVYGIIAARLDTLTTMERQLLLDAAVVGRTCWAGAVQSLSGIDSWRAEELIHSLERKQLIRRAWHSSLAGDIEFGFSHALIRDVAYSQVRRAARAQKHEHAAAWLDRLERDDLAELIAYHYRTALELHRELGTTTAALTAATREALAAAGAQADAKNGFAAAARHYAAALELAPLNSDERPRILFDHSVACFHAAAPGVEQALMAAFDAQVAAQDWWSAAKVGELLGEWYAELNDEDQAEQWWSRAVPYAERSGHVDALVRIAEGRVTSLENAMRYAEAIAAAEDAAEVARNAGDWEGVGLMMRKIGSVRAITGDPGGVAQIQEAVDLLDAQGSRYVVWAHIDLAQTEGVALGDLAAGRAACERAFAEAQRFGEARLIADAEARLPWFTYMSGDWAQARALTNRLVDSASPWGSWFYLWAHGMMAAATGEDDVVKTVEPLSLAQDESTGLLVAAAAAEARGDAGAALVAASRSMAIQAHEPLFAPILAEYVWYPALYDRLADLVRGLPQGEWKQTLLHACDGRYAEAADLLTEIGAATLAARTHLLAARIARDRRHGAADIQRHAGEALRFYSRVGATRFAERAHELMRG
jgi:class 3 adenylate cyclase/tetratricopeptide (TPR) repeat protein